MSSVVSSVAPAGAWTAGVSWPNAIRSGSGVPGAAFSVSWARSKVTADSAPPSR